MNTKAIVAAGLMLGAFLPAQEKPVAPDQGVKAEAKPSVGGWIQDLGSGRYRTRVEAENKLREAGKDALPALRKAAESDTDGEVQWRARRLIRQIESGDEGAPLQRRDEPGTGGGTPQEPNVHQRFDDVFQQLERDFGIDVPRARFFHDDFFRDLDQQFQDLQQRMQQGGGVGSQQGMTMRVGPDGVHVEVQEKNAKGDVEKKVYDAPDMETFQQQYPDVLKGQGLGGGLQFWMGQGGQWSPFGPQGGARSPALRLQPMPTLPRGAAPQDFAAPVPPAEGERLGVRIQPDIAPEVRQYLGLDAGTGVMVESVQDGTLAQDLGLAAGDIVTKIADTTIGSPADIRAALGAIDAGKDVEVVFVRKGAEKTAKATKKAAAVDKAAAPQGAQQKGLQRRGSGTIR